jgi:SH3-like domain-containing protein
MKSAILNKAIWVEIIEEEGDLCLVRDKDVNEVWVHKNHLDAIETD